MRQAAKCWYSVLNLQWIYEVVKRVVRSLKHFSLILPATTSVRVKLRIDFFSELWWDVETAVTDVSKDRYSVVELLLFVSEVSFKHTEQEPFSNGTMVCKVELFLHMKLEEKRCQSCCPADLSLMVKLKPNNISQYVNMHAVVRLRSYLDRIVYINLPSGCAGIN